MNSPDPGLSCLAIVARLHGLAADPAGLAHELALDGKPAGAADILRATRIVGLKAKVMRPGADQLAALPLPALAWTKDGSCRVLVRVDADKVLLQDPHKRPPEILPLATFVSAWDGSLILLRRHTLLPEALSRFNLGWFLPALRRYRGLLLEVLAASFFLQVLALLTPLFFQVVIDKVLVHRGLTTLDVLCVGLVVISLFEATLGGLRTYVFAHTTSRIDVELGARLFRHLLSLPMAYFAARRVGDSVARVRELETIRSFLTGSALTVLIDAVFTVVFLALMAGYSGELTMIVLAAIPAYVALSLVTAPLFRRRLDEKFQRGAENQAFLVETVSGIETVKAMAVEPQLRRRWEEQLAEYVRASFSAANLGNIASQTAQLVNKLVVATTLWLGARLVIEHQLTVGQLVAFNMLSARVTGPLLRLVQLWQDFQQTGISLQRLGDILDAPGEPAYGSKLRLSEMRGAIRFDEVTFRYAPDRAPALERVSFALEAGEVVGIVGSSGSGKSTLARLIQRLYVAESGRVLVDGADTALLDPAWLRRNVGIVLQENMLFRRTVRENIALADPGMPLEHVAHLARLAGAHDFILQLPLGYETVIEEHGANLSGGQRQRIAIARALAGNPRILIFDEATSALDYESERIVQDNMRAIARGRTVLIIAHRLSAVRSADRIFVIEKGRLVEEGPHQRLLAAQGRYARLHAYQSEGAPA